MRIEIEIPKEFEKHFNQDKFKDSFERIMADIKHSLENGDCLCAGRYEHETIEMLENAFENSKPAYSVDKIVDEFEKIRAKETCNKEKCDTKEICRICVVDDAIEIVKHSGVSDDACEWRLCDEEANVYDTSCRNPHILIEGTPKENNYEYCPYCGKKIKVVE